jgi:outer membrane lipopolysaccharide assembly protein LptE/RlpB
MRRLVACIIGALVTTGAVCLASEVVAPVEQQTVTSRAGWPVRLQIDQFSKEQVAAGLDMNTVKSFVEQQLKNSSFVVSEDSSVPSLVLRIRSVTIGLDIATFIQLSFTEEAMLARNRSMFQAVTWSQASLIGCPQKDLSREVTDVVKIMLQAFAKDYAVAMQPLK